MDKALLWPWHQDLWDNRFELFALIAGSLAWKFSADMPLPSRLGSLYAAGAVASYVTGKAPPPGSVPVSHASPLALAISYDGGDPTGIPMVIPQKNKGMAPWPQSKASW